MEKRDIFGPGSNFSIRYVESYNTLKQKIASLKNLGFKIILTQGTFDMFHIGHAEYLERGKELGDVLIVGLDEDKKVRTRKGPGRPVVSEEERIRILCHCRSVDLVFLKHLNDEHWQLVKIIRPDVLLISERMKYTPEELEALKEFCEEVVCVQSQSTTSTTARIRSLVVQEASAVKQRLEEAKRVVNGELDQVEAILDRITGGKETRQ